MAATAALNYCNDWILDKWYCSCIQPDCIPVELHMDLDTIHSRDFSNDVRATKFGIHCTQYMMRKVE